MTGPSGSIDDVRSCHGRQDPEATPEAEEAEGADHLIDRRAARGSPPVTEATLLRLAAFTTEPSCPDGGFFGEDDATEMVARVTWADDRRTGANYRLTVAGSY